MGPRAALWLFLKRKNDPKPKVWDRNFFLVAGDACEVRISVVGMQMACKSGQRRV